MERLVSRFLETNTYVVGDPLTKRGLLIDPNGKTRPILDKIAEHGLSIEWIVNTHGHIDHILRNREVQAATGARIAVGRLDAPLLHKPRWYMLPLLGRTRISPEPDLLLDEGDTLKVGSLEFSVLHTPGHTPGGICLKHKKALFCGDLLFAGAFGRSNDLRTLFDSIKDKVFVLSDDIILYPGHGPKTTIEAERKANPFYKLEPEQLERMLFSKRHVARLERERAERPQA